MVLIHSVGEAVEVVEAVEGKIQVQSLVRISSGIVLRSTILISSMQGMIKNKPGPMAPPWYQQNNVRKIDNVGL